LSTRISIEEPPAPNISAEKLVELTEVNSSPAIACSEVVDIAEAEVPAKSDCLPAPRALVVTNWRLTLVAVFVIVTFAPAITAPD
jgi:hypothetical protein